MIQTDQTVTIDAPIDGVWTYARDIAGWAKLMPGLQDCAIIDENHSRWTLKVGAGALVRTVKVLVHVERWAGPEEVDFSYRLEGDPVTGDGAYRARGLGPAATEVVLNVRVKGEGPMAPMWEAMGKPLLPTFARGFAEQFKQEVERTATPVAGETSSEPRASVGIVSRLLAWLRTLFGAPAKTERKEGRS